MALEILAESFAVCRLPSETPTPWVGVLALLAVPFAEAEVPILALSAFDTDYLLVKDSKLPDAVTALENAGHTAHDLA